jgi:hypothetical protein
LKEEARIEGRLGSHRNFSRICIDKMNGTEIKERERKKDREEFGRFAKQI